MKTLLDLFLEQLADVYDSENRLTEALPHLARAVHNSDLRTTLEEHLQETNEQISRLERVFAAFESSPHARKCQAMAGLLKEGQAIAEDHEGEPTLDAALIATAQKAHHYQIASYGCLIEWADLLGNTVAGDILEQNLGEKKCANEALTHLARSQSNIGALAPADERDGKTRLAPTSSF